MTKQESEKNNKILKLPKHLLLFVLLIGLMTPFVARLPSVPIRGWEWLTDYFPALNGLFFISAFNLIPSGAWYTIGKLNKRAFLAFWFSVAGGVSFLLFAHGSVDLRSSSTASIALLFIPIYSLGAIISGLVLGLIFHAIIKAERMRIIAAWSVCIIAIFIGTGISFHESACIVARESRFPFTAVSDIPLKKKMVYRCDSDGRIKVLELGNFDNLQGDEIAVLDTCHITMLQPDTYKIKSKTEFKQQDCDQCVHMYPYLVPDGKGSTLVSTSDGVSDINGHLLWKWEAEGFSRVVPIQSLLEQPNFVSYQYLDNIVLHNADGKQLWRENINVSNIGRYTSPEGDLFLYALIVDGESKLIRIYNLNGNLNQTIKIPDWVYNVEEVSWPARGHFLVGIGGMFSVMDKNGNEILNHTVKDTSFNPYHGPNGTAVKFDPDEKPYLAVLSHGSSGYARSVLLIFGPNGHLVWQEELNKLRTLIAVPSADQKREVLLVGGMDGIIEFSLTMPSALSKSDAAECRTNSFRRGCKG